MNNKYINCLTEHISKILNLCEHEFGKEIIYSNKSDFELTETNIKKVFNILNNTLFDSNFNNYKNLKLYVGNSSKLNSIIQSQFLEKGQFFDISIYLGLYFPKLTYVVNKKEHKIKVLKSKEAIFINTDKYKSLNFAYILAVLCHEMIHCYDSNNGTLLTYTGELLNKNAPVEVIDYLSHFTSIFKQKTAEMKKETNITIPLPDETIDFEQINIKTATDIQLMKEGESIDGYIPVKYSTKFKNKYNDFIHFNSDGSICLVFGQKFKN